MTVTDVLEQAKALSRQERKELMKLLVDTLDDSEDEITEHSILELAGLGQEIWEGVDPQEYVNQLRKEWDHRP